MADAHDIGSDLGYVRDVIGRAEAGDAPRALWFLWAAISAVGFPLIDLRPEWVPLYWAIAAPLGFVVSAWLGWRHGRRVGQESVREGMAHMLHWGACMAACFLLVPLAARGALPGDALPQAILLVVALAYFLAGVHLVRPLVWVGLVMFGAYLAVLFSGGPVWTAVGIVLGLALVATGWFAGRRRG